MEHQPLLLDGTDMKAILCILKTNVHDHSVFRVKMDELKNLAESLGIEVVGELIQSRYRPFAKYHIGSGKVHELQRKKRKLNANIIIFYNILRSSQKLNLIKVINCEVIDRYELTLEIFEQMASDTLSKLQIQSARLEKQAPFYKLQASINYRHDRPFFRAGGEYAFHGQLRELTRNQSRISEEIDRLIEEKKKRIWKRKNELGYPIVCIAGFYNAGKTSLFNVITGDNKPVSDRPFTTLSSKYQRRFIDYETTVLFIDTIGFVLDLDPRLIQSFKLNLLDIRSSDIVILLLEITDPLLTLQLKLTEGIKLLREIGVNRNRIIIVFNKLDKAPEMENIVANELKLSRYDIPWLTISANHKTNIQDLLQLIAKRLRFLKTNLIEVIELSTFRRAEIAINRLLEEYPVENSPNYLPPFNSLVRTILSQNTSGKNARTAYNRLSKSIGTSPYELDKAPDRKIKEAIKPAGMHNQRTKILKALSKKIIKDFNGEIEPVFKLPFKFQDAATPDRFKELHLSLIKFGQEICTARNPKHHECVLKSICPFPEKGILLNKQDSKKIKSSCEITVKNIKKSIL
jgi:GTP-binding protein HflX